MKSIGTYQMPLRSTGGVLSDSRRPAAETIPSFAVSTITAVPRRSVSRPGRRSSPGRRPNGAMRSATATIVRPPMVTVGRKRRPSREMTVNRSGSD